MPTKTINIKGRNKETHCPRELRKAAAIYS